MRAMMVALVVCGTAALPAMGQTRDWPTKVQGFVPPNAGEHPRLLFRKADVPAMKQRAQTPEGKAIIAQLRTLLGENGEAFPEKFNTRAPANQLTGGDASLEKTEIGTFTISHGAGYGLLYQLTGDKRYADLARQAVEKVFEGQVDRDERYSWKTPGTGFRLGTVHMGVALAYDLAHDGWPEEFRKKVVTEIQTNKPACLQHKKPLDMETMLKANGYPAGSNHHAAYIGGTIMSILATKGDAGSDDKRMEKLLGDADKAMKSALTNGFGDHGWFAEGTHTGRIAAVTGLVPALQSLKVAGGMNYVSEPAWGEWVTLRYVMETTRRNQTVTVPSRGAYGSDDMYDRVPMMSHSGGEWCMGFGAVEAKYRPAMLWTYNTFVEQAPQKLFDARSYPHQAVFAFVNWPIGEKEANPATVMPKAVEDKIHGYYVFRNRWQDSNDIIVTGLNGTGPRGYHRVGARPLMIYAFGGKSSFGELNGKTSYSRLGEDGSAMVTTADTILAIDFSKASGADAVIVMAGKGAKGKASDARAGKGKFNEVMLGGQTVKILQLSESGTFAEPSVDGETLTLGKQKVTLKDGNFVLGTFTAAK